MSEVLRATANNTANAFGGYTVEKTFAELNRPVKKDMRTEQDVIAQLQEKMRKAFA